VGLNQGFNVKQRMCPVAYCIMKAPNFVAAMTADGGEVKEIGVMITKERPLNAGF